LTGGTAAAILIAAGASLLLITGTLKLQGNSWIWGAILFQAFMFMLVAVGEEWLFRGYLYGVYRNAFGPRFAVVLNSILFTATHLFNPDGASRPIEHIAVEMVNIFLMAVLMSQARLFSGTLWLPISLHFMLNFVQSTVFGFVNGGKEVESLFRLHYEQGNLWNGAGYGLESSLLFTPVLVLTAMVYGYFGTRSAAYDNSVTSRTNPL
jgi:uncharacterized protein